MERRELLEILNDWNFWRKDLDTGIERAEYLQKAMKFLESNMILSIIGVRRSGKSFLMRQIAKNLIHNKKVDPKDILIINFEDKRFTEFSLKLLDEIFETYLEYLNPRGKPFVFLDEVHKIEGWEKWVRTFHELQKGKIIISGSTSQLLKQELATLLTGRHLDIKVFPLSFKEFLNFKTIEIKDLLDVINKTIEIKRLFREYMEFGGFPEVTLSKNKKEILLSYFDDIITRDIAGRYNVRKTDKLRSLTRFYLTNISNHITFTSLEQVLGITTDTIEKFSSYLEESGIISFIKRFSFSVKDQEKASRKVYSIDTGIANAIGFRFSENIGRLMENVVTFELNRSQSLNPNIEIYYWKGVSDKEVDFIVKEGLEVKQLIQVCSDISNLETKKREIRGLLKVMEEFKFKTGLVITEDFEAEEKIEKKRIIYKPLWKWLLNF